MSSTSPRTEISVGLFVLLGAVLVGGVVMKFSGASITGRGGYPIIVEVKDATGIREGVPVRLGGIDIGRVSGMPGLNEDQVLLSIPLEIFPEHRIPEGSTAKVGTSGLMGDSFVRILPPDRPTGAFLPEGHRLIAEPSGNLADLAGEAGEAFDGMSDASVEIRAAAQRVERLAAKLEGELLSDQNLGNLGVILAELKTTSVNLRSVSGELAPALAETRTSLAEVGSTAKEAKTTFGTIDQGMKDLGGTLASMQPVLKEFDGSLDDLRTTLAQVNSLLDKMENGDGLAAALLNDGELKRDLESFVDKLNRSGILFYPREGGSPRIPGLEGPETTSRDSDGDKPVFPGLRRQP
jgi:phospholipid/cholesterol/gamma-HCH transport system substrate-binding protein